AVDRNGAMGRKMLELLDRTVKAIGIPQPQAWLVINGYLSRLAISQQSAHTGKALVYALPQAVTEDDYGSFKAACNAARIQWFPKMSDFEIGGFLGTVTVVDCEAGANGGSVLVFGEAAELGFR